MRAMLELPRLSLTERDRRYAAVRKQMAERGLDAIVLWGWPMMWDFYTANARYLSPIGGNAGLDDMLEKIRAIKSEEELEMLRKAAGLGDLMLATCRDTARAGVKECEVYAAMMQTMTANGGEEPTLFLWNCDRYPYPHPFRLPTMRQMQTGDLIICEMHPKYGG